MKEIFLFLFVFSLAFAGDIPNQFSNDIPDYKSKWKNSVEDFEQFWQEQAKMVLWDHLYEKVWQKPLGIEDKFVGRWFVNGKLNIAKNCVERWQERYFDAVAFTWLGEDNQERIFTYGQLAEKVNKLANFLKSQGIVKGDRVCIWLPMVPELIISQLACAKIGAIHSVIFAGFSPNNVYERILDAECKMVITIDEAMHKGKKIKMKEALDPFLANSSCVNKVLIVQRTHCALELNSRRDLLWENAVEKMSTYCDSASMDAEDPLFILYTSGTTGKPKGIVHSTGGYLIYVMSTMRSCFNVHGLIDGDSRRDTWFCTADIGWITGHSYVTYAPLALGVKFVIYEGAPTYPHEGRLWEIIDRYKVTHLYTSPTLIRSLMVKGIDEVKKYSLLSLKVLGSVGEPINPEAWQWYYTNVGHNCCPIIDTYWQTETGGVIISPMAGVTPLKAGSCSYPLFGIEPVIMPGDGALCIKRPWPGMMRTIFKDHQRFLSTYLNVHEGFYFTGDEAYHDEDGYYWIIGRLDDVIKVSGHRFGSAELERAVTSFPSVVEAAVIGVPHAIKGQSIIAFIVLKEGQKASKEDIVKHVQKVHGVISTPDEVFFVEELPKTRSGKILRRLLRDIVLGKRVENTATLVNPSCIEKIRAITTLTKN
jgi:acetyl-CoA synthetase